MTVEPLPNRRHRPTPFGQYEQLRTFPNGYAASIIHHADSYGARGGLFEIAIIDTATGEIVYDTPLTPDVIGDLDFYQVAMVLDSIAALAPRHPAP